MKNKYNYIDLFAGCGGLSLGLSKAGWLGEFAIEKDAMAFETLKNNMVVVDSPYFHFKKWPNWLPIQNHNIKEFLSNERFRDNLQKLHGKVALLAGGPPCQGFSVGGARRGNDERNELVFDYLEFLSLLLPEMVMIENVEGMARAFKSTPGKHDKSILEVVIDSLSQLGYTAAFFVARALDAGVPQDRRRVITFGIKKDLAGNIDPARLLESEYNKACNKLREQLGLPLDRPITIGEAIDDLSGDEFVPCPDSPKFNTARYTKADGPYAKLMRKGIPTGNIPNSHRFSQHGNKVFNLYKEALETQKAGRLSKKFLLKNNTKTQKKFLLGKNICASTITTHPDENIHYKFPRNVTLREMARLQSFPDDFHFYGRYTLNGERRKLDVSRCAQIGNAVPVLMAQALGMALKSIYEAIQSETPHDNLLKMRNSTKTINTMEMFL